MNLKPAFIHDALPFHGGAERTLETMLELFPGAPVFTLVHNPAAMHGTPLSAADIRPSWLNRLPGARTNHYRYFPLFPLAVRSFDLRGFDIVIASHYAVATWARTRPGQRRLAYIYTPLRYLWGEEDLATIVPALLRPGAWLAQRILRLMDRRAAGRLDRIAASSRWIAGRIERAWGRQAEVIYPPVEVDRFRSTGRPRRGFVCLSRLARHKRLDIVVRAFNRLALPLELIGDGPERERLEALADPNVTFLGRLPDDDLAARLGRARACVHMAAEDFGIGLVEAQAAGCPAIAFAAGGNLETVIDGETGILVSEQSVDALVEAVRKFIRHEDSFDPSRLQEKAGRFSKARFLEQFAAFIRDAG